ncbi:MAG: hypothetical protein CML56_01505 [Rhodobacteraceae bacterium]|nr:hypothetical protein [Paracoccaceae bacterium]
MRHHPFYIVFVRLLNRATAPISLAALGGCGQNDSASSLFSNTKDKDGTTDLNFFESNNFVFLTPSNSTINSEKAEKTYSEHNSIPPNKDQSESSYSTDNVTTSSPQQSSDTISIELNSTDFVVAGNAIKGPLENAVIFLDFNNDGLLNEFRVVRKDESGNISGFDEYTEPFVRSNIYGEFEINTGLDANEDVYLSNGSLQKVSQARLVTITDQNTIDRSSDQNLPDIMLSAPAGSTVITPLTTLMEVGNLSSDQIKVALGLQNVVSLPELNTFNHYLTETFQEEAVKIENFSQQMIATITAYSGAMEKTGLDQIQSYQIVLSTLVELIDDRVTNNQSINLYQEIDLGDFSELLKVKLNDLNVTNPEIFFEYQEALQAALLNLNIDLETVSELFSNDASDKYSQVADLRTRVKETMDLGTSTFDFSTGFQAFSGERLGIGNKIPVTSVTGESGLKIASPNLLLLDNGNHVFVWSYFDQNSINQTKLVMSGIDNLQQIIEVFSKPGISQFDAETIVLTNNKFVHATSFRDIGGGQTQISLVSMVLDPETNIFVKADEIIIPVRDQEDNTDPALLKVGENKIAVSWTSYNPDENSHDVYAQFFTIDTSTGTINEASVEFRLNKFTSGDQTDLSISSKAENGFTATWVSTNPPELATGTPASDGSEIYMADFGSFGPVNRAAETLRLTISEDEYNTLQIRSGFQVGSINGKIMAFDAAGITNVDEITVKNFTIEIIADETGQIMPVQFDASSLISDDDIRLKHNGISDLEYKILSQDTSWNSINENWLKIEQSSGIITGSPALFKIGYNEVSGLLPAQSVANGTILAFEASSQDSVGNALELTTIFNSEEFINGFDLNTLKLGGYNSTIMAEASISPDLRPELKADFLDVLQAFDDNGDLVSYSTLNSASASHIERWVDNSGLLTLHTFDGDVLQGTNLISLPELFQEASNNMQGLYGLLDINPITGAYSYDLSGVVARNALAENGLGQIEETYLIKYSWDELASAGVGGVNYDPSVITLDNGYSYVFWLNHFPESIEDEFTEYKEYQEYEAGAKVSFAPNFFKDTININTAINNPATHDVILELTGANGQLDLSFKIDDNVFKSSMVPVDGTRITNPIIEPINNDPLSTTEAYPGNYEFRTNGYIDLESLGGNIGWLRTEADNRLSSSYGDLIFDPVTGSFEFRLKWGENYEFKTGEEIYNLFSGPNPQLISENLILSTGTVQLQALDDAGQELFLSEAASFDGVILSKEEIASFGQDELSRKYDVISEYITSDFDSDAQLDFKIISQEYFTNALADPTSALEESEAIGSHGSIVLDQNSGEYFYTLNRYGSQANDPSSKTVWEYALDFAKLFDGEQLVDNFTISFSDANKNNYTSLRAIEAGELPEIGTDKWIENTENVQLMLSVFDAGGIRIVNPTVIDQEFSNNATDFDAKLITDSHILVSWTKGDGDGSASIVSSYLDINANADDLSNEFHTNEFVVSRIADFGTSKPQISKGLEEGFSISWEAPPFLTLEDLNDLKLVYELYDVEQIDVTKTSYFQSEPDDRIIEDFEEFELYLRDTGIFDGPLENKIQQLDQNKVSDYLEDLGDFIYYVDYGTDYYGLPELI